MNSLQRDRYRSIAQTAGELSIAGMLFFLPFSGMSTIKEFFFFAGMSALIAGLLMTTNHTPLIRTPLSFLMAVSIIWSMIALVNAIDPPYSLDEILHKMTKQYAMYFVCVFFAARRTADPKGGMRVFFPLCLAALIMSAYACYQFSLSPVPVATRVSGFTGAFYRLAVLLVLTVPIAVTLAISTRGWVRWMATTTVVFGAVALFFTFARGAWIGALVGMTVLMMSFASRYRKAFISLFAALLLAAPVIAYYSGSYRNLIIHGTEQPRIEAARLSWEIIRNNPVTGIGYGKTTFAKYYPDVDVVRHAHNIFLNTTVEVGVVGLLLFLAMLVVVARDFVRVLRHEVPSERRLVLSGISASLAGFLTLNLFDYMYHGWPGQVFWMLVGIGYAFMRRPRERDASHRSE